MTQKTPLNYDDQRETWQGAFSHLLNDTKIRIEKKQDQEDIIKKQVQERASKSKVLLKSNKLLKARFAQEIHDLCLRLSSFNKETQEINYIDYRLLMELLGYGYMLTEESSRLIE